MTHKRPRQQPTLLLSAFHSRLKRNPVRLPTSRELRELEYKLKQDETAAARRFQQSYQSLLPKKETP